MLNGSVLRCFRGVTERVSVPVALHLRATEPHTDRECAARAAFHGAAAPGHVTCRLGRGRIDQPGGAGSLQCRPYREVRCGDHLVDDRLQPGRQHQDLSRSSWSAPAAVTTDGLVYVK